LIIGLIAGTIVDMAVVVVDKMKIDDPVGAIAVHGVNGFFGTIAVGLFSEKNGLFFTGESAQFITQLIGVSVISLFSFVLTFVIFHALKRTMGIRLSHKAESAGIDAVEFGVEAYTTFE
jgi:Amt family ammonium transporter